MADHGPQEAVTGPRPLRGLLLAVLPLVLGFAGASAGWDVDASAPMPPVRMMGHPQLFFTPESGRYHYGGPVLWKLVFLAAAALLSRAFFTWGRSGRAPLRRTAVVVGLLWLVSASSLLLIRFAFRAPFDTGTFALDGWIFSSTWDALLQTWLPAGITGLLVAWLVGLGLQSWWQRGTTSGWQHREVGVLVLLAALTVTGTLFERLHGARFFSLLSASAGLRELPAELEAVSTRWGGVHVATLVLWALLVSAALLRVRRAGAEARRRRAALVLLAALLGAWGVEALGRRWLLTDAVRLAGAAQPSVVEAAALATVEALDLAHPMPALRATRAGLTRTSSDVLPWTSALQGLLAQEQRARGLTFAREGLPHDVWVGVGPGLVAQQLSCLLAAAREHRVQVLTLVAGPTHAGPAVARRTLRWVHPELPLLLGPRGPSVRVRVTVSDDYQPASPPWVVVVPADRAPFVRPRDARSPPLPEPWPSGTPPFEGFHPVIPVLLEQGAPVEALWEVSRRMGPGTFDVESPVPCARE